jgi:hypothetical protein
MDLSLLSHLSCSTHNHLDPRSSCAQALENYFTAL